MGEEKNHNLMVLSTYAVLQKAAKSYLEYAIEIRPISNYAERRRAWKISSLSVSLEIGSSMLEYGIPSGKNSSFGIYFGQLLISKLSSMISSSWPKPPEKREIMREIMNWASKYKKRFDLSVDDLEILAKGVSSLLQALFLYADAILETSVGLGTSTKEEWEKLIDLGEELEKEILLSLKGDQEI